MAIKPKYQLKDLFEKGDLISQTAMSDLIDSTYNPTLISGSNIFITKVDTPSGAQITISSGGGGGGGGTPSGSDTEIQYNDNGAFGSDPNFTREGITGDTDISHNTNNSAFLLGDALFGGLIDGAIVQAMNGTDLLGLVSGVNAAGGTYLAAIMYLDTISLEAAVIDVRDDFEAEMAYIDNLMGGDLETSVRVNSSGIQLRYNDTSIGSPISNMLEVTENGVTISSDANSYTLPLTDGTAGQLLRTDGAGVLDWVSAPIILEASVTIASADVLTLNSVPIDLIPAPGVGYAIEVLSASMKMKYSTTQYATNTQLELFTTGATIAQHGQSGILALTNSSIRTIPITTTSVVTDVQLVENAALTVTVNTGNPTAGDSDITVYATYRIITL